MIALWVWLSLDQSASLVRTSGQVRGSDTFRCLTLLRPPSPYTTRLSHDRRIQPLNPVAASARSHSQKPPYQSRFSVAMSIPSRYRPKQESDQALLPGRNPSASHRNPVSTCGCNPSAYTPLPCRVLIPEPCLHPSAPHHSFQAL